MTATDLPALVCPQCASHRTTVGASGNAMCADCLHYWDPSDPTVPFVLAPAPFAMAPVDDVFGTADAHDPETFADRLSDLTGGTALLEGGQTVEIVSFTDHDTMIGRDGRDDLVEVPLGDVLSTRQPVEIPAPAVMPETVDEMPPDVRLAIELAKVIVRAGAESVNGTGADITPGVPPVGFLPSDPELHPVIERAAGLAVGMLLEMFELDVDQVLEWAGAVTETDVEGDQPTEASNDDTSTANE